MRFLFRAAYFTVVSISTRQHFLLWSKLFNVHFFMVKFLLFERKIYRENISCQSNGSIFFDWPSLKFNFYIRVPISIISISMSMMPTKNPLMKSLATSRSIFALFVQCCCSSDIIFRNEKKRRKNYMYIFS